MYCPHGPGLLYRLCLSFGGRRLLSNNNNNNSTDLSLPCMGSGRTVCVAAVSRAEISAARVGLAGHSLRRITILMELLLQGSAC